ncbi:MAG: hypothetical protein NTX75_05855 [Proteobacteria bacterium]|nr:hypothetical protein [Pseudomonadota bacterium]
MPKILLNELKPGMKLAKPVLNEDDITLLGEDTELTEAVIEKLKTLDVYAVYVKGVSKPDMPREEALLELDKRFEKVEHEPYMDMLKRVLKEHIEGLYG